MNTDFEALDQTQVLQTVKAHQVKRRPPIVREALVADLEGMEPGLRHLVEHGGAMGLEAGVMSHLRPHIHARADELAALI